VDQYALNAGKHVLSEKPFASNATEALLIRDVARAASGQIVEGFHYLHHQVNQRLRELVTRSTMVAGAGRRSNDGPRLLRAQCCPSVRSLA